MLAPPLSGIEETKKKKKKKGKEEKDIKKKKKKKLSCCGNDNLSKTHLSLLTSIFSQI